MLFNSLSFLIFFPITTALYFLLPHKFRWALLLLAGCIFYIAFIPSYILILFFIILVDYGAAFLIDGSSGRKRKVFLAMSIVANVGLLAFFKYYGFAADNVANLANFLGWNYSLPALAFILPLGLSFHTFQAMSYTIEVYRGNQKPEKHLGIYALYVLFYPQLVAGPIERPQNLIHQFYERHDFDYDRVTSGLKLMLWGFFKKMVIADKAAIFVDVVYNNVHSYQGVSLWVATILFAFQIYCDFSGYSDIAIGSARVLGIKLMDNFKQPYFAKSIAEFWQRWHISLSSWFRDYLYIPLGGNRVSRIRWYLNIMIVFLVSGLWHGANWKFVIWGALHGFYQLVGISKNNLKEYIKRILSSWTAVQLESMNYYFLQTYKFFQVVITFMLVSFAWIFFRAPNIDDAFYVVRNLLSGPITREALLLGQPLTRLITLVVAIMFMEYAPLTRVKSVYGRWGICLVLFWSIIFLGQFGEKSFIYFVF